MKISRIFLAGSLCLAIALAFGQGGGGRQAGPGGPGGGRQGGGMRMRGGGRMLLNDRIQKELKMTDAQIGKAQKAFGQQGGPGGAAGGGPGAAPGGRGGPGGGQMSDADREKRRLETEKQIKGILDAKQFGRFEQITFQMAGPGILARPDMAKRVGLTADQSAKIKKIQDDQMTKMRSMFQSMGGGPGGGQNGGATKGGGAAKGGPGAGGGDIRAMFTKMRDETNAKIMGVLNASQKQKWAGMQGTKFNMQ